MQYSILKFTSGGRRADWDKLRKQNRGSQNGESKRRTQNEIMGAPPQGSVPFLHAEFDDGVAHVRQHKRSQHHPVEKSKSGENQCEHHPSTQLHKESHQARQLAQLK